MQPCSYSLEAVDPDDLLAEHDIALDTLENFLDINRFESERLLLPIFRQIALELQRLEDHEGWFYFKRVLHEAILLAKAQETRLFLVDGSPSRQKRLEPRARIIEILGKILPMIATTIRMQSIRTALRGTPFHPELEALGSWLHHSGSAIVVRSSVTLVQDRWLEGRILGRLLSADVLEDLIDDSERLETAFVKSLMRQEASEMDTGPKPLVMLREFEASTSPVTQTATITAIKPKPERKRKSDTPPPRPKDPTELIPVMKPQQPQAKELRDDAFEEFFLKLIPQAGSAGCRWVQQRLWIPHPSTAQQLGLDPQSMVEQLNALGVIEADQKNPFIKVRPYREQRGIYIRAEYSDRIRNLRAQGQ